jgi:Tfp pilus assembly protein PilX
MTMSPSAPHRPPDLRRQEGITLIVVLGVMFVTSLLVVGAFTAARGEVHLTSTDTAQKKAYYAAQAGISDYEYHLTQDGNYLSYCTEPSSPNPALNQVGETTHRATVPSTTGEPTNEQYAIQLLPAESAPSGDRKCDRNHLVETMLEEHGAATGTFRIESTGYSGNEQRTLVATLRNANFVSFVWYTKFETADPAIYGEPPPTEPTKYTQCEQFYGKRPGYCANNFFITGESINGPMHTEDHVGVCGKPTFGRSEADRIEFRSEGYASETGYSNEGCGTAEPTFKGDHIPPSEVPSIEPPPGDEELQHIVEAPYEYKDKTEIVLEGATMTVKTHVGNKTPGPEEEKTTSGVAFPPNGVIYVAGSCSKPYSPFGPVPGYNEDSACGNVYVHGEYTTSLTIGSQNDIVINGNITTPHNSEGVPTSNAMLGLIANNFVRFYHPLSGTRKKGYTECGSATNDTVSTKELPKDLEEPTVYAAMLAVKHSVIVDNFDCGSPTLGHVNIYGAVAGLFSNGLTGIVNNGTIEHGYPYNAKYDNRLQVEEPPHFLNPIQAAWYVQRETLVPNP